MVAHGAFDIHGAEMDRIREEAVKFAGIGLYRFTFDGTVIFMNRGAFRILDLEDQYSDPAEVAGKNIASLIVYTDRPGRLRELVRKHGHVRRFEYSFRTLTGKQRWVLHDSYLVRNAKTGQDTVQVIIRDITERKQTEAALRESEERFRSTFENSLIGLYRTTPDGRILMANSALVRMLGYSSLEELAERNLEKDGYEPTYGRSHFKGLLESQGQVAGLQSAWLRRDGTTLWVQESARVVRDQSGKAIYYEGTVEDITRWKQAEEELLESQRALATLMGNLPGMAYRCRNDRDWTVEFVSEGCRELTGYQPADLVHNAKVSYAELIHPDDREFVWNSVQPALAERRPFRFVYRIRTAGGEEKWVWEQGCGVFTPAGELLALEGFIADVTERERAEEQLQRERDFVSAVLETTGALVIVLDTKGRIVRFNRACETLTGYSFEEVRGKPFWDHLLLPEEKEAVRGTFEELRAEQFPSQYENHWVAKDGARRMIAWSNAAIVDDRGEVEYVIGTGLDVTERRRVTEELRQSQRMLELVLDSIPARVFWKDRNFVYLGCNQVFARDAGVSSPAEIVGKTDYDLPWKKEETDFYRTCDRRVMSSDTPEYHIIEPVFQADGREAWVDTNKVPLHDAEGKVVGILGTYEDITERKRAEAALREAHDLLEDRVRTRTAELREVNEALQKEIAERKLAQETLRESEAKYRQLFETVPDAIMLFDVETREFVDVNESAARLYGYNKEEFLRLTHSAITAEPEESAESFKQVLAGELSRIPLRYHRKRNGAVFPVEISASAITLRDRQVLCGVVRDITERMQAEEALRQSEEQYRSLIENANDIVFRLDGQSRYTLLNDQVAHVLGYAIDELLGEHFGRHIDPRDLGLCQEAFERAWRGERGSIPPFRCIHKDGSEVWMSVNYAPLLDADRQVADVFGFARDITEHMRADEALRESEERFRTVVESSKDAMVAIGPDGRITLFNRAAEDMFGWSAEQMVGQHLDRLMPTEYRRRHRKHVRSYFATGEPSAAIDRTQELPGVRRNGEAFDMELSLATGGQGEKKIVLAVMRDVTARKQAEKALREAEQRYRQIFESTNDAMLLVSPDNDAVFDANPSAVRLLGRPLEQLRGTPMNRFLPAGTRARRPARKSDGKGGEYAPASLRLVQSVEGRRIHVEADTVEMTLGGGQVVGLHILRDVSDRMEMRRRLMQVQEEERRRISRDIHDGVTQLLVGAGLRIDRFTRHLTGQPELSDELGQIRSLLNDATRDTREVCTRLRPDILDDFGLIPSIRSYSSAMAPEKPAVHISESRGFGRLPADVESALYRIAQEALANTVKHAHADNVRIAFEQDGRHVTMEITDDGCGFDLQRVLSSERAKRGVGLANMAERVQLLAGRLSVISALGKGTTIRVDVEILLDDESPDAKRS